ncbi:hypothetical protein [Stenotrophomonas rhizophila]|uniref:hypothetical protein n=1 Tax=Stenotrophomonas rhizophila TaxID=216778 RepID=UPI0028A90365|nr:hypothetical protein [Stenotrophomonas rhizophila]
MSKEEKKFAEKLSKACTAIAKLPMPYHGSLKGIDHSSPDSPWSTADTIASGLSNCAKAQGILREADFKLADKADLQAAVAMLKNRAESLSAESDGLPAIATFSGVWVAAVGAMSAAMEPLLVPVSVAWATSAIALIMGIYFLYNRLKSRRKVSVLKELANHIELFEKSLKKPEELEFPARLPVSNGSKGDKPS